MDKTHSYKNILIFFLLVQLMVFFASFYLAADRYADSPLTITRVLNTNTTAATFQKGNVLRYEFTAHENNLGIVSLFISTFNRENKDNIIFRIKEEGKQVWLYTNRFETKSISGPIYYPFGFPLQTNSKGKRYVAELFSQNGREGNAIGVSLSRKILIKYVFNRSEVLTSPIPFSAQKLYSYRYYMSKEVVIITSIPYFIVFLLYLFKCRVLNSITPFFTFSYHREALRKYINYLQKPIYQYQLMTIGLFFILFFDFALIASFHAKARIPIINIFFAIYIHLITFYLFKRTIHLWKRIRLVQGINAGFIISLLLIIILRSQFIFNTLRWDSGFYFQELIKSFETHNLPFSQFFSSFQWGGHASHGLGFFLGIFTILEPSNSILLNLAFFALHIILFISFYFLLRKILPYFSILMSTMLATSTLIFTSSILFSTDYPSLVFFVLFLTFYVYRIYILALFAACLSLFSKEIGVLVYGVFIITYSFFEIYKTVFLHKNFKNYRFVIDYVYKYIILYAPLFLYGLYILLNKGKVWGGGVDAMGSSFGINEYVLYQRVGQMLVLNWNWLLCILILGLCIFSKKRMGVVFDNTFFSALFASSIVYFVFNLTYITVTHPRYVVMAPFFLNILIAMFIQKYRRNNFIRVVVGSVIILNCIQIFRTIDPISKIYFSSMKFGNHTLLKVSDNFSSKCDSIVYNTEYTYMNRLLDAFNKEVQIKKNDTVIFSTLNDVQKYTRQPWLIYYEYMYIGKGYQLTYDTHTTYRPTILYSNSLGNPTASNREGNIYYVFLPWLSNNIDEGMKNIRIHYTVGEEHVIDLDGYWLRYYKLSKLPK